MIVLQECQQREPEEHRLRGLIVGWCARDAPGTKSGDAGAAQSPAEDAAVDLIRRAASSGPLARDELRP